ncbi:hypothetical protein [Malikia spinosa]|jgi:hypothetical protein|uniref:hypothetical protein n=1 Tax=Malikia spinosa TaxID=86180 RepID=UPI003FA1DA62
MSVLYDFLIFFAGAAIGGLLSWLITHFYYLKSGIDQKAELAKLQAALKPRNTLSDFEDLLRNSAWTKSFIGEAEIWMADVDSTFQIERGESAGEFREVWTAIYPDPNSAAYPVYLKINGVTIKELRFISIDGGRIFVPMAGVRINEKAAMEYFWNLNSLEILVCRIIGSYYIYESLEGVAGTSKIMLIE